MGDDDEVPKYQLEDILNRKKPPPQILDLYKAQWVHILNITATSINTIIVKIICAAESADPHSLNASEQAKEWTNEWINKQNKRANKADIYSWWVGYDLMTF